MGDGYQGQGMPGEREMRRSRVRDLGWLRRARMRGRTDGSTEQRESTGAESKRYWGVRSWEKGK